MGKGRNQDSNPGLCEPKRTVNFLAKETSKRAFMRTRFPKTAARGSAGQRKSPRRGGRTSLLGDPAHMQTFRSGEH